MTSKTPPSLHEGLDLFNRQFFFAAHEALEDLWNTIPRSQPRSLHLQGLVQLAVAFHHQSTGNYVGGQSVLERALRNLQGVEDSFPDLEWDQLRIDLKPWVQFLADKNTLAQATLAENSPHPALPQIGFRK